jgi:hypothetical protein
MKRVFSLILSLFILFGVVACSPNERSPETSSKPGTKDTLPQQTESTSTDAEDFQAGIPEEYRLKINAPADWGEPLPTSEYNIDFPLFGINDVMDPQQPSDQAPVTLPKVGELFTVEELEAYFGMNIKVGDVHPIENSDGARYLLYEAEIKGFCDGEVNIWIYDWGDQMSALSTMNIVLSDPREIEGLGKRALISKENVYILVKDGIVLTVSVEFVPPDSGGWMEPADEELLLDFARLAYDRTIGKLE